MPPSHNLGFNIQSWTNIAQLNYIFHAGQHMQTWAWHDAIHNSGYKIPAWLPAWTKVTPVELQFLAGQDAWAFWALYILGMLSYRGILFFHERGLQYAQNRFFFIFKTYSLALP